MPIATIQVAATSVPDQWTLGLGPNKVVAVQSPDDDNTTRIDESTVHDKEQYTLAASGIPAGSTINTVTVRSRSLGGLDRGVTVGLVLGGNTSIGPDHLNDVYTTFNDILPRPGGGAWLLADLPGLEVFCEKHGAVAGGVRCTSLWVLVDYTLPAGGSGSGAVFGPRPLYPRGRKRIIH